MTKLFKYIQTHPFIKKLLLFFASIAIVLGITFKALEIYTHHNQYISVPNFQGLKIAALDTFVQKKSIHYKIIDSVYDPKLPIATIQHQEPEAGTPVKENRTIYLYVTTVLPPQVSMPKLIDKSLKQATNILTTYGLKQGRLKFIPDQCVNCVLDQLTKGHKVAPGTQLPKGSVIDLIIGQGLSDEQVTIPDLTGLTRAQAIQKLSENSLNAGAIIFEQTTDSIHAKVYKQSPSATNDASVSMGSSVDLFLSTPDQQ